MFYSLRYTIPFTVILKLLYSLRYTIPFTVLDTQHHFLNFYFFLHVSQIPAGTNIIVHSTEITAFRAENGKLIFITISTLY